MELPPSLLCQVGSGTPTAVTNPSGCDPGVPVINPWIRPSDISNPGPNLLANGRFADRQGPTDTQGYTDKIEGAHTSHEWDMSKQAASSRMIGCHVQRKTLPSALGRTDGHRGDTDLHSGSQVTETCAPC
jgi:hypothetical protein